MTTTIKAESREQNARNELVEAGCVFEKREDREGVTRTGWWQDGCWLSKNPILALEALKG